MTGIQRFFKHDVSTEIDENGNLVPTYTSHEPPWKGIFVKTGRSLDNPFTLARKLTGLQWLLFTAGWLAWTLDAYDFFSVSLTVTLLSKQFGDRPTSDITRAITLTLLFRSVGAVIFGGISDRYGRKWVLVINLILLAILQMATGFVNTYSQFLGVRSVFGIAMGGIWGLSSSMALENMPVECRGLFSGILQQGYAFGYLIAAIVNLYFVPESVHSWRVIFWLGAGLSFAVALFRIILPDSKQFREAEKEREKGAKTKQFLRESKIMFKEHWIRIVYLVLLMTGFNFMSHGSQDLYPTYMQVSKGFSSHNATVATIIGNVGAIVGGTLCGWLSQAYGRRLIIIIACFIGGCLIPLWIIPSSLGALEAGAFLMQFCVQGAWGVIPIHLAELAPPAFRASIPGVAYQLGNMVSSSASQIEATFGETLKTPSGKPDYGKVQGILMGVIFAYVIVLTLMGREHHSSHFEQARAAADGPIAAGQLGESGAATTGMDTNEKMAAAEHREDGSASGDSGEKMETV